MRDFSSWRFANNSRHAKRLSRLLKPQTKGTTGLPGVNDDGSRFPGKSNPLQHLFFLSFFYLNRSVDSKRQKGFQNYDSRQLLMFLDQGWNLHTDFKHYVRSSTTFHSKCDNKGPTVTIIRVGKYIFGGYTSTSWGKWIIQCFHFIFFTQWNMRPLFNIWNHTRLILFKNSCKRLKVSPLK